MKAQIQAELEKLLPQIKKVTLMIKAAEDAWAEHYDRADPEDMYLRDMFNKIGDKLDDARQLFRKVNAPVVEEGILKRNENGRYSTRITEFTSGQSIEYLERGQDGDLDRWVSSRVEHNGDYYIAAKPKHPLEGLIVRIKSIPFWD